MTVNMELVEQVLQRIEDDPAHWDQGFFVGDSECGTTFCFAGFALLIAGRLENSWPRMRIKAEFVDSFTCATHFETPAKNLLGFTDEMADEIFYSGSNFTPAEFREYVYTVIKENDG